MELNIGMSEWNKNVDNYNGRNFESHAAPAERLSTVSSPFMVYYLCTYEYQEIDFFTYAVSMAK